VNAIALEPQQRGGDAALRQNAHSRAFDVDDTYVPAETALDDPSGQARLMDDAPDQREVEELAEHALQLGDNLAVLTIDGHVEAGYAAGRSQGLSAALHGGSTQRRSSISLTRCPMFVGGTLSATAISDGDISPSNISRIWASCGSSNRIARWTAAGRMGSSI
jgi:hypothetical protein